MSDICAQLMMKMYGHNIWDGFMPTNAESEVQGWNGTHPSLSRMLAYDKPHIVIDVGVWKGQSTITLANNIKRHSINGVVIAVDTFLGSPEHWQSGNTLFNRVYGLPNLYQTFLSNVHAAGLSDWVIPMAQTSTTACRILKSLSIRPTLVHVDAAHDYRDVLIDIEDYWDILDSGGYLIGDDYDPAWVGVVQAADEFSKRIGKPLDLEHPKFILQK